MVEGKERSSGSYLCTHVAYGGHTWEDGEYPSYYVYMSGLGAICLVSLGCLPHSYIASVLCTCISMHIEITNAITDDILV